MPVSKKRKKKQKTAPVRYKKTVAPKKRITRQQILIYVISGLMILSLAIGFIATGSTNPPPPTPVPQNILVETPAPQDQGDSSAPAPEATSEPAANDNAQ